MVPRVLLPGGLVLAHPLLLSVGRAGDKVGFPSVIGWPCMGKVKGLADVMKNISELSISTQKGGYPSGPDLIMWVLGRDSSRSRCFAVDFEEANSQAVKRGPRGKD